VGTISTTWCNWTWFSSDPFCTVPMLSEAVLWELGYYCIMNFGIRTQYTL
jgi:hypothetical protein